MSDQNPTDQTDAPTALAPATGSARLEAMKRTERATGRIWCSICRDYGSHYSSECASPLGMVAPNNQAHAQPRVTAGASENQKP